MLSFSNAFFVQKVAQVMCAASAVMNLRWEFGFDLR